MDDHHPSAEFIGLVGPLELEAFKRQLREGMSSLRHHLKDWKENPTEDLAHYLNMVLDNLARTFHLECRLLQTVIWQHQHGQIDRENTETLFRAVPTLVNYLLQPPSRKTEEILIQASQWLRKLNPDYLSQVVFAHSYTTIDLTAHDHLLWAQLERNQVPHLRWNVQRLAKISERPAVEVVSQTPSIRLTVSQQRGLELLTEIYSLHRCRKQVAGISTQPHPLLIGPSGSGKTALIRYFSEKNKLPLLDVNSATWVVSGAASHRTTLRLIRDFINNHAEGLLYIDELDKFAASTDWMRSVQQECLALLDRRTGSFENWTQEDELRLERFFIVGSGTWQSLYYEDSPVLGFDLADEVDLAEKLMHQKQIPDEVLFRFPHVIELKGLSLGDFKQRIIQVRAELKLPPMPKERLAILADEAIKSRRQNRWLQQYLVQALRERSFPQ